MNNFLKVSLEILFYIGVYYLIIFLFKKTRKKIRPQNSNFKKLYNLILPFEGEWNVFWGGDSETKNHHHGFGVQHFGIDFVIEDERSKISYKNDGKKNSDFYCFEKNIIAPINGKIVVKVDGIPDNQPGQTNVQMVYGNTVMIQDDTEFVVVLAHLKCNSIIVSVGDLVQKGDVLGVCGNSGNSSEPHLHFHVQSEVGFEEGDPVKTYFNCFKFQNQFLNENVILEKNDVVSNGLK